MVYDTSVVLLLMVSSPYSGITMPSTLSISNLTLMLMTCIRTLS